MRRELCRSGGSFAAIRYFAFLPLSRPARLPWKRAPAVWESECSGREERRVKVSLKMSGLPTGQTLENFDFAFQPAIERPRIDTLATGAWIRNAETVLMQGPPGVGKTHLSVALGTRAIELGFSVLYYRFDELMTALKVDAGLPPSRLKRRRYMNMALLIIDELGFEPMTREEASLFFRLITYRYGRGAILITTNKIIRDWTELLAGDEMSMGTEVSAKVGIQFSLSGGVKVSVISRRLDRSISVLLGGHAFSAVAAD
ncbi:MAG: hypothetical protein EOS18_32875 [Mesorhizobium sp.]|nr:MAG: hypothetical protein EOS18_32875 [Mesorhizobium sp.]